MRRKTIAVAVAFSLLVAVAPAVLASHGHSQDDPWTRSELVLTFAAGAAPTDQCNEGAGPETGNGVTGRVWALPDGADDHRFNVSVEATLDVDVDFYEETDDGSCSHIGDGPNGGLGFDEQGDVPAGATHAVIVYWAGAGSYVLQIPDPNPPQGCEISPFC